MTIDELINELEKTKEEHGNLNVVIYHRHDGYDSYFTDDDIELLIDDEKHYVAL